MMLIAEIGKNYREDARRALLWVPALMRAGVDAVTLQIRENEHYDHSQSWRYRLPDSFYAEMANVVREAGLKFGIAIAEPSRVESLAKSVDFWKMLSRDFENTALHTLLEATGKRVFASTGVSSLEQIVECARQFKREEFIHTQLSLDVTGVNLKAIETIRQETGRPVAFGLHCKDHEVLTVAMGFEPSAMFFYVRDSGSGDYPDRDHAITLEVLPSHVDRLRRLAPAIGSGRKEAALMPKDGKL